MNDTTDPLANYKLPVQVSKGIWLALDNAAVRFRVLLPSELNRAFTAAFRRRAVKGIAVTGEGEVDMSGMNFADAVDAQIEAFAETCIKECSNENVALDRLWDDYPEAVNELYDKAMALAEEHGEEVETATKKQAAI